MGPPLRKIFLLAFSVLISPQLLTATSVVGYWSRTRAFLAADSRVTVVETRQGRLTETETETACKIHVVGTRAAFSHSGLYEFQDRLVSEHVFEFLNTNNRLPSLQGLRDSLRPIASGFLTRLRADPAFLEVEFAGKKDLLDIVIFRMEEDHIQLLRIWYLVKKYGDEYVMETGEQSCPSEQCGSEAHIFAGVGYPLHSGTPYGLWPRGSGTGM